MQVRPYDDKEAEEYKMVLYRFAERCSFHLSDIQVGFWSEYPNPIERNSSSAPLSRFLPIQIRSILCVFSTGEPCKDRLILTAIPCRENPNSEHFF